MDRASSFDRGNEARQRQLETLDRLAQRFGASLSGAFAKNVEQGRRLDGVLNGVGRTLLSASLKASMKPLRIGLEGLIKGAIAGDSGSEAATFARGGAVSRGLVMPFARGGVVAAPTYFPL